ncbi:hypothetical protein [Methyloversatilis sp.]|uniref:hypothetical protein n=1 Tax=Methyloversatilis sp. TaxID=2569862 RepID=UPI0035B388E0
MNMTPGILNFVNEADDVYISLIEMNGDEEITGSGAPYRVLMQQKGEESPLKEQTFDEIEEAKKFFLELVAGEFGALWG